MSDTPKNSSSQVRLPLFVALALAAGVLIGANSFKASPNNTAATAKGYLKFRDILSYIDRDYVDTVNIEELSDYAITQMLEKLDPHTAYIPASEMDMARSYLEGDFEGIGVEFNIFRDTVRVVTPLSGGPSEAVGLQAGDKILKVNGKEVLNVDEFRKEIEKAGTGNVKLEGMYPGFEGIFPYPLKLSDVE